MTQTGQERAALGFAVVLGVLAFVVVAVYIWVSLASGRPDGDTTFIHDCRAKGGTVFLSENAGHNYCRLGPGRP